jgi:hypothetical protein
MADSIGPNALDRIAGINPTKILEIGSHSNLNVYAIQLGTGATITACAGVDPDGNAYNFVTSSNWDAATADGLLTAGANYVINSITIAGGVAFAY